MSLISMPFVDTGFDTGLHVVAGVALAFAIFGALYGFWKFHELPIHHADKKQHGQMALVTILTWIGFIWHWVWVLAVIIAFVDAEQSIRRVRQIWTDSTPSAPQVSEE
ncbi:MFS transporter [Vibrio sp. ZSDE26]|uniref:MFS transporter n=1 Tax=Vibrio amylolyticus TaxID=2847292 RepID=A0A9X1XI99_9VIBR|nr:MFS transporter [Vibrio amylolyticus]MCK6263459.1 MFS transporter [Vibrio amylolyticus]